MSRRAWFLVASLGLLAYGALCFVRFPIERRRALAVPRMTCGQLFQKGPIAEEYVTLDRRAAVSWRIRLLAGRHVPRRCGRVHPCLSGGSPSGTTAL
jgi:hypothetical protein